MFHLALPQECKGLVEVGVRHVEADNTIVEIVPPMQEVKQEMTRTMWKMIMITQVMYSLPWYIHHTLI